MIRRRIREIPGFTRRLSQSAANLLSVQNRATVADFGAAHKTARPGPKGPLLDTHELPSVELLSGYG